MSRGPGLTKIDVLDNKGYVRLVDHMGTDFSIINAARVSFDKEATPNEDGSMAERDIKLMKYLVRNNEMAVFRQATVQFEMYMPLMIARQYFKYIVGVANVSDGVCMNETSRRYITEEPTFYIPAENQWRSTPDNKKQGSGDVLDSTTGQVLMRNLEEHISQGESLYNQAMDLGVCAEQARLFLPAYGMYVRIRSTMSLAALLHLLRERLDGHAQEEFQEYARAMYSLTEPLFPVTFEAILGG